MEDLFGGPLPASALTRAANDAVTGENRDYKCLAALSRTDDRYCGLSEKAQHFISSFADVVLHRPQRELKVRHTLSTSAPIPSADPR